MTISRVLFATRARRIIAPLLSLVAAALAVVGGDGPDLILAAAFLLVAVLFKVTAELSGRTIRFESRVRSLRRDIEAMRAPTSELGNRLREAEANISASTTRFDAAMSAIAELEKRQSDLDRRLGRVVEALQPIRRHRLETEEDVPDLTLRSSTVTMLRRFRQERSRS